ncbi:MAG: 1-acyl-sn-glycerol-3-phosphate acyltransferase, partial [Clostridia bacterium]|nr:1-acyl-sn-glycerol-3-phosphate acyltransferase [Clostridia bacterium]
MSKFYRAIKAFLTPIVKLIFRTRVVGLENIPKDKPFMLCCNHTSMLDIVILIVFCPRAISFMAKKEIFKVPVLSGIFKRMGAFPVDRGGRDINSIRHS